VFFWGAGKGGGKGSGFGVQGGHRRQGGIVDAPAGRIGSEGNGTASAIGERNYRTDGGVGGSGFWAALFAVCGRGPGEGKEGEGGGWGPPRVNRFKILVFGDYFVVIFSFFDRMLIFIE
jgi:hypothetical protein